MNEVLRFAVATATGGLLGAFYFVGLWWTVRSLPRVRHPWITYFGSVAVRLAVVLAGFFLLLELFQWQALAVSLLGFIAVRMFLVRFLTRSSAPQQTVP